MTARPLQLVLRQVSAARRGSLPDGELLALFVANRDEAAFATLVRRHGGMVQGVCRSVLHHQQDAEDAAQAVFLVLARKAASIRKTEALASWLHGVAYRIACKARTQAARRRRSEHDAATSGPKKGTVPLRMAGLSPFSDDDLSWREVQAVLHAELQRLPDKYRLPLILCCLEGRTRDEAARQLGWTFGTLKGMLDRGRELLRKRLERRGVTLTAALATITLTQEATAAGLAMTMARAALAFAAGHATTMTSPTAVRLAEAAVKAALPLKTTLAALFVAGVMAIGAAGYQASQSNEQATKEPQPQAASAESLNPKLDRFGDPLPAGALVRLGTNRLRHGSSVRALVYSPDGKLIASGADDYTVRLSDAATGREVRRFPKQNGCTFALAFTADGKHLAGGNLGGEITVWDVATGKVVRQFERQECSVKSIAFLPGDKQLVSGGSDGILQVWDVATGKRIWQHVCEQTGITSVAVAADGKLIASATREDLVRTWDPDTGKQARQFPFARLECVALSPDGRTLAAGGGAKEVILWNTATGRELRRLTDEGLSVSHLSFSRDGKLLASANGGSGLIVIWESETGKIVTRFRSDRTSVATVAFSPDGKTVATGGDDQIIRQWDVASGKEIRPLGAPEGAVRAVAFSPDGKTLASAGGDLMVRLWDVKNWKERNRLQAKHPWHIKSIAYSADGTMLGTAGGAGFVNLWDPRDGKALRQLDMEGQWTSGVAISPDAKLVAVAKLGTAVERNAVEVWDAASGERLHRWNLEIAGAETVAFSPDGKLLAAAGPDIQLWATATRQEIRAWKANDGAVARPSVDRLAFTPDGRLLVSGENGGFVHLWDYTDGRLIAGFKAAEGPISAIAISRDSATLACRGRGNVISLWDIPKRKEICRLVGHESTFLSALAFSPDGRMLASGSDDTTVLIWDVSGRLASARAPAPLSATELEKHWANLASDDVSHVSRSLCELVPAGKQSVGFLKERLRPSWPATADQEKAIAQRIADLGSETFETRENAMREVEKLADMALPALRRAQKEPSSLEARRRVDRLLSRIEEAARQDLRAVEVLEHIGTPEARGVLEALAKGAPEARLTREAKAALDRLERRAK
jgi:RNA polymerase sigma factor (sigma-70 family)